MYVCVRIASEVGSAKGDNGFSGVGLFSELFIRDSTEACWCNDRAEVSSSLES